MAEGKIQKQTTAMQQGGKKSLQALIKSMEGEIKKALPSVITPERFTRMTLTAIRMNPRLGDCTSQSFLGAMMMAAQTGLEPNTPLGLAHIIPRQNHKKGGIWEAQFQIGYKGMIALAYRSGEISLVEARVVHENDEFICEFGLEPKLKLVPASGDRGAPVKVYALYKTKNGSFGYEVAGIKEIDAFAKKRSDAYKNGSGPWVTDFLEMAKKTVLKRALKTAPMSSEFARAVGMDETVKTEIDEDMYAVSDEVGYEDATGADYVVTDANGEVVGGEAPSDA